MQTNVGLIESTRFPLNIPVMQSQLHSQSFIGNGALGRFFEEQPIIMAGFVVSELLYKSLLIVSYEECNV